MSEDETKKEGAQRKNISVDPAIMKRARAIMNVRGISDFSNLIATLVREYYEQKVEAPSIPPITGAIALTESHVPAKPPLNPPKGKISYRRKKK